MTTPKKIGFWEEARYYWVHSRPYTKRMRSRAGPAFIVCAAAEGITFGLGLPAWLGLPLILVPFIYALREFLIFFSADFYWEAKEKDDELGKLLSSPDLHQRFTALGLRLRGRDAEELVRLQEAMEFGTREAQRLAEEIRKYEGATEELRERKEREQQAAKAAEELARLLDQQGERLGEIIERKGRSSQWKFVIIGAVLGAAIQYLAQWIF